jgi:hypothetical protein
VALQDHQLVAKDYQLDIAIQIVGGTSKEPDQAAHQQIHECEEHDRPPREEGADPTNPLLKGTISGLCALQDLRTLGIEVPAPRHH